MYLYERHLHTYCQISEKKTFTDCQISKRQCICAKRVIDSGVFLLGLLYCRVNVQWHSQVLLTCNSCIFL